MAYNLIFNSKRFFFMTLALFPVFLKIVYREYALIRSMWGETYFL